MQLARFKRLSFSFAAWTRRLSRRNSLSTVLRRRFTACHAAHIETNKVTHHSFENHSIQAQFFVSQDSIFIRAGTEGHPIQVRNLDLLAFGTSSQIERNKEMCQADETNNKYSTV